MKTVSIEKDAQILAIETSGSRGSVALSFGSHVLLEKEVTGSMNHSSHLLPVIDGLCREQGWEPCQIEQIYVSAGPGSFTGIRIGITLAKSLGFAVSAGIVAVPSLEVLAMNGLDQLKEEGGGGQLSVVVEAGQGQIFAGVYELSEELVGAGAVPGLKTVLAGEMMPVVALLERTRRPLYLLGPGLDYHADELGPVEKELVWLGREDWPGRAGNVVRCGWPRAQAGQFTSAEALRPIYLRRPEAELKWQPRES